MLAMWRQCSTSREQLVQDIISFCSNGREDIGSGWQRLAYPNRLMSSALTQAERVFLTEHLSKSGKQFDETIDGLSVEQVRFKPAPDKWSVAECCEHVLLIELRVFQMLRHLPDTGEDHPVAGKEEQMMQDVPARINRFKAPDFVAPSGRWPSLDGLAEEFRKTREKMIRYAQTTADPLHKRFAPHMAFGVLSGYQWLVLLGLHTERHMNQAAEVKADPAFPKTQSSVATGH